MVGDPRVIHDEVRRLTVAYPKLALPTLLGDLVEVQDLTFRLLEHGRVKPLQARELYLLAGITSGMLAKASHDLGNPSAAMMQARTAFVCADNADHHAMRAWVRSLQSLISYWAGRPAEAADYADLGQAAAGSVRGTTSVWLACLSARAHALLGDGEATRAAIQRAEDARAVLDLPIEQRNFGITSSAQRVHAALASGGRRATGVAADLREEIEAFTASPTSVLIR
ncbi:hypothetical protein ACIRVF_22905 [Kitasatospora sp. NPDC101157]|uniref:hypothetical protein n=1 Tax=Kitasatospora sp. NPDC101157 TaxID=3364098 RepID=UPI0038080E8C